MLYVTISAYVGSHCKFYCAYFLTKMEKGESLTDLGKWAAKSAQIIGYFPLIISKTVTGNGTIKTYKFTWSAFLPYFSCLLTAASFTWCLVYFWRYKEFKIFIEFKAPTEAAAYNLMIITSTLSGMYMKLFGVIKGKQYQEFWEHTRLLLDKFTTTTNQSGKRRFITPRQILNISGFQSIRKSCRLEFLLLILFVILHVSCVYGWPTVWSILDENLLTASTIDSQLYFGLGFWTLGALLHVGNGIWTNFFVKIYTECLHTISIDLKQLKKLHDQTNHGENQVEKLNNWESQLYSTNALHHLSKTCHKEISSPNELKSGQFIEALKDNLDKLTLVDHEVYRFNRFFGNILLLQISNCVISLLAFSFFACLWSGRGKWNAFAETLIPLGLFGAELLGMGSAAEDLADAAENVLGAIAEDVVLNDLTEELYLKIQIVSVQLCTKPPLISARQFFTINRSLVTSVVSALATFLVVLVQFQDQDDEDAKELMNTNKTAPATTKLANNMSG